METGLSSQPFSHSTIRCNYYYCFLFILQVQLVLKVYSALCKEYGLWEYGVVTDPSMTKNINVKWKGKNNSKDNFICMNWL